MWIPFVKMHGLGNSFIIVEKNDIKKFNNLTILARDLLDPNIGLSGDQFIIYEQSPNNASQYEMWIYNLDGSTAKACGNGTRCLAKLIHDKSGHKHINIKVSDRTITCVLNNDHEISVNMGRAIFDAPWVPTNSQLNTIVDNCYLQSEHIACVDMGNRHLVIFNAKSDIGKQIFAGKLSNDNIFSDSTDINNCNINVNLAQIDQEQGKIYLETYERNTGFTLACGSGACASFIAARKLGLIKNNNIEIIFKLGSLFISTEDEDIIMTGPAILVAQGQFNYE